MPDVLLSRESDEFHLSAKSHRLLYAGNLELHFQACCTFGIFVNYKQGPLFVRPSHCIRSYGRAGLAMAAVSRFFYADWKYLVLLAYRLHPFLREELSGVVGGETV